MWGYYSALHYYYYQHKDYRKAVEINPHMQRIPDIDMERISRCCEESISDEHGSELDFTRLNALYIAD